LFTDGLKAEREQGITIDVAYRYFSTENRKFIIADTPGHIQYTRNMATGASTANVGIILIDARLGVIQQSRRHAYIASLLGIPHLLVAVNKMDLRNYDREVFDEIVADFRKFAKALSFKDVKFVPISAKLGDNVVHPSEKTQWYTGGTLLQYLETVPVASDRNLRDFRFPVQYVLRPNLDYRGFSGEVAAGVVKKGDQVMVLPSRKTSTVIAIDTFDGELNSAFPPQAITIRLADEIDISRGDMLVHPDNPPHSAQRFDADIVWLSEKALDPNKSYLLKHSTQMVRANIESVQSVLDLETLQSHGAETLALNDIGKLRLNCHRPVQFDAYTKSRSTGAFILIDSISNNTVAAGMIIGPAGAQSTSLGVKDEHEPAGSQVSQHERAERLGQRGGCIVVQGDAEAAYAAERSLFDAHRVAAVVSGGSDGQDANLQAAARMARAGLIVLLTETPEPPALAALSERVSGRVLTLNLTGSQAVLEGEVLTSAEKPVAATDLEHLGRALVATLHRRGWLLDAQA
ncbi:MAG: hypothetical protein RJA70_3342, partial [Pseudomonadota bacterium]